MLARSWQVAVLAGIPVHCHWSIGLLVPWLALFVAADPIAWPIGVGYGCALALVMAASVLAHEAGHALAARRRGVAVREIVISPLVGCTRLAPGQRRLTTAAALEIILAGPATNGLLALAFLMPAWVMSGATPWRPERLWQEWGHVSPLGLLAHLIVVNALLLAVNLWPVRPLDGGQACAVLLARLAGDRHAAVLAQAVGVAGAAGLALVGVALQNGWVMLGGMSLVLVVWQTARTHGAIGVDTGESERT